MTLDRDDVGRLRNHLPRLEEWSARARQIADSRVSVTGRAAGATRDLVGRAVGIDLPGPTSSGTRTRYAALPLVSGDRYMLQVLRHATTLPPLSPDDAALLHYLTTEMPAALTQVRSLFGVRRIFRGRRGREEDERAARFLLGVPDVTRLLTRLADHPTPAPVDLHRAMLPAFGLGSAIAVSAGLPAVSEVVAVEKTLAYLPAAVRSLRSVAAMQESERARAHDAATRVRTALASHIVERMPVERVRDVSQERIATGPLRAAGLETVAAVLGGHRLSDIAGIGHVTARRVQGAAQTLWHSTFEQTAVRIDTERPTREGRALVAALHAWDRVRQPIPDARDIATIDVLEPLTTAIASGATHVAIVGGTPAALNQAVSDLTGKADRLSQKAPRVGGSGHRLADPWQDFQQNAGHYYALLEELGFSTANQQAVTGGLPSEIVDAIRRFGLDTSQLTASLRGYQSFAARFSLVQRRVVIGDEMGLGKTVEAIAALAHLHAAGKNRAMVVCPAAVLANWMREVRAFSRLTPHLLHGVGRTSALKRWQREGGVAVTTYETLGWLEEAWPDGFRAQESDGGHGVSCVVVDEAHYIKNPAALRSRRAARLIASSGHALLLTGTPLENRVEEFRSLVGYIRPDLVLHDSSAHHFRKQVAPVYLRRKQEDVLAELPETVEVEDLVMLTDADRERYREAVASGNFHSMRQAAMLSGLRSGKFGRLLELVEEAEDNGRKVVVFSHYRAVLNLVVGELPGATYGPLTGSMPPAQRQKLVDDFTVADAGAALVAQIQAGGVGLNIQAASVVVICEPQLKPTIEWQAIARARRMGQTKSVQVHRLLAENSVDQRIQSILRTKAAVFEDFADESDMALAAPEAVDVSEAQLVREVVRLERERLGLG